MTVHYLVYFLGPLLLGLAGAKILRQRFTIFWIGFVAFLVAWIVMQTATGIAANAWHLTERSFLYGLIVSLLAGVHNMVAFNLHRLPHAGIAAKVWIGFIILTYGYALYRLLRALPPDPPASSTGPQPQPHPTPP